MTTGSNNSILGAYNGNQDSLDIRTSSNNIVLSDGDGTPYAYREGIYGQWYFTQTANNNYSARFETTTSSSLPYGILMYYPNAAPNDTNGRFITCSDSSSGRMVVYNNGNVANLSLIHISEPTRRS